MTVGLGSHLRILAVRRLRTQASASGALDEDVVHATAPAVDGDGDADVFEGSGGLQAGQLAALVRVALQGFREGVCAWSPPPTGYPFRMSAAMLSDTRTADSRTDSRARCAYRAVVSTFV